MTDVTQLLPIQVPHESYFLCTEKFRPSLFGVPIVVPCCDSTTYQDLYRSVWTQVSRLVTPSAASAASSTSSSSQPSSLTNVTANHATDCDDSLGYQYPFVLKVRGGFHNS